MNLSYMVLELIKIEKKEFVPLVGGIKYMVRTLPLRDKEVQEEIMINSNRNDLKFYDLVMFGYHTITTTGLGVGIIKGLESIF